MQIGVTFPQIEIGTDISLIREYVRTAETENYDFLTLYDHVLGADTSHRPEWRGAYHAVHPFQEPLVFFGWLAGVAPRLALATGVLVLPQRQTALVAKQAAQIDVLTGGRFRLGVGIGWNQVEYEGLGQPFKNRARRYEEQVEVLRLLWTKPVVDFHGRYHDISEAGINPLPVQQPIPLWMGGTAEPALQRIGRLANGWMAQTRPTAALHAAFERIRDYAETAGRNRDAVQIEGRLSLKDVPEQEWKSEVARWREFGASYLAVNTMGAGLATPQDHIDAIRRFKQTIEN